MILTVNSKLGRGIMYGMDEDMGDTVGKKSSYGDESLRELGGVGK